MLIVKFRELNKLYFSKEKYSFQNLFTYWQFSNKFIHDLREIIIKKYVIIVRAYIIFSLHIQKKGRKKKYQKK